MRTAPSWSRTSSLRRRCSMPSSGPTGFRPRGMADTAGARFRQLAEGAARAAAIGGLIDPALLDRRRRARAVAGGGARRAIPLQRFLEPAGAARAARARAGRSSSTAFRCAPSPATAPRNRARLLDWSRALRRIAAGLCAASAPTSCEDRDRAHTSAERTAEPIAWIESPRMAAGRPALAASPCRCPAAAVRRSERAASPRVLQADSPDAELAAIAAWARTNLAGDIQAFGRGFAFPIWPAPRRAGGRARCRAGAAALLPGRADPGAPYAVAGGTPLADLRAGARGARSAVGRRRERSRSSNSAPCCARRSCRPRRRRRSPRRGWTWRLRSRAPSEAPLAAIGWRSRRLSRAPSRRPPGRRARSACRPRARALDGAARQSSDEPLDRRSGSRLRSGPLEPAPSLVERRVSIGGAISRIAGDARGGGFACSALIRAAPPKASCGARRAIRPFKCRPASRPSG